MNDEQGKNSLEEIRKKVEARAEEEARQFPTKEDDNGITSKFIRQCLYANELGDGMLYTAIHKDKFLYVNNTDEWLSWAGHHWQRDIQKESLIAVEDVAKIYANESLHMNGSEGKETINYLDKRVRKLRGVNGRNNCLTFAHTHNNNMSILGDEIDVQPWLFPCKNGVIDLRTGGLRSGKAEDFLLRACPTEWNGIDAPAPLWCKFLMQVFEEKQQLYDYLQRLLGYGLLGMNIEHIFPILTGQGRNGKGTIIETLMSVLGSLAGPIQATMLLDQGAVKNSSGPSPDIMSLKGLRLAFASETDEGRRISPSRVKWLTGGDTLVGRYPHDKHETTFTPTHTLFLLTNHIPHAPSDDFAFWERAHIVPFNLSFVDRDPRAENERPMDKSIPEKLKAEAPGILAWLVKGCLLWQERGLDPPMLVKETTAEKQREEDLIADFIDQCCEPGENYKVLATELFDSYKDWYANNVSKKGIPSQKRFGNAMTKKRFKKDKKPGVYQYYGLQLI
jgi:putative DNA primase/helicase